MHLLRSRQRVCLHIIAINHCWITDYVLAVFESFHGYVLFPFSGQNCIQAAARRYLTSSRAMLRSISEQCLRQQWLLV